MAALKKKKLNSVLRISNPISKPDNENEKWTQAGKTLIVSRGRPKPCVLCSIRHSAISCPLVDPVNGRIPVLPSASPAADDPGRSTTLEQRIDKCQACQQQPCS